RAAAVPVIVVALPLLWGLGRWPPLEPDEARNAEVAREMLALGRWSVPQFNGLPYLDKPALFFWLMAAVFRVLGAGEVGARLPAAVGALATIALTFAIGRLLFPGPHHALLAGLIVSSPP